MIEIPNNYSQWVKVIEIFKEKSNDDEVITVMKKGTIEWQTGVAERFTKKLFDAVNIRMNHASDKFQKDISRAGGQEGMIVQAILSLRKEMAFLANAMDLQVIPQEDRQRYIDLVLNQADIMQKSLEDSAKNDHTGRMSSIIRNHKVNSF